MLDLRIEDCTVFPIANSIFIRLVAAVCQLSSRFETKLVQRYESLLTVCYMRVTVSVVDVDPLRALKLQTETAFLIANSCFKLLQPNS